MYIDILLDDSGVGMLIRSIAQMFHHTKFERSSLNDLNMPLNTTRSRVSNLYVASLPGSQISPSFALWLKIFEW